MDRFPDSISRSMRAAGSDATCVPVRLGDRKDWEAACFVHVSGPECKQDRRLLRTAREPLPIHLDARLIAHRSAAIVSLDLAIDTLVKDPLKYEILLVPGGEDAHYQVLKLLAGQRRICWFFGDNDFRVIQAQEQELEAGQRATFETIAREAFAHDSLLRISNHYDKHSALTEIVSHYALRDGAGTGVTH